METMLDRLPENEPDKIECPACNDWYLHDGACDLCGYKTYKLENENGTDDNRLLRLPDDSEQRQDLEFN